MMTTKKSAQVAGKIQLKWVRSSICASLETFLIRSWSSFESVPQIRFENTRISGIIRWPVFE